MRTHFERLFRDYQVRSRSGAVAAWLQDRPVTPAERPGDECPYARPFPEGFRDCPAYQELEMVTLDIGFRSLGRIWTCRHLLPRRHEPENRWYASCVVGGPEDRARWAAALGQERLLKIEALQRELAGVAANSIDRIWRHKRRQLELIGAGKDASGEYEWLRAATGRVAARMDAVLRKRRHLLEEAHLPEEACRDLIRLALDRLVNQRSVDFQLEVPDDVLARFPPDMRLFFRPQTSTSATGYLPKEEAIRKA